MTAAKVPVGDKGSGDSEWPSN